MLFFFVIFLLKQRAIDPLVLSTPRCPRVLSVAVCSFLGCFLPRRRPRTGHDTRSAAAAEVGTDRAGGEGNGDVAEHTDKNWRRQVSSCEHVDAPHYGKGFCRPCYMVRDEKQGR